MSAHERTDLAAVKELESLVRHLADELASFRKRALTAESKLKDIGSTEKGAASIEAVARASELERENARLRRQVETATARTKGMLDRVRFLRQQAAAGGVEK